MVHGWDPAIFIMQERTSVRCNDMCIGKEILWKTRLSSMQLCAYGKREGRDDQADQCSSSFFFPLNVWRSLPLGRRITEEAADVKVGYEFAV